MWLELDVLLTSLQHSKKCWLDFLLDPADFEKRCLLAFWQNAWKSWECGDNESISLFIYIYTVHIIWYKCIIMCNIRRPQPDAGGARRRRPETETDRQTIYIYTHSFTANVASLLWDGQLPKLFLCRHCVNLTAIKDSVCSLLRRNRKKTCFWCQSQNFCHVSSEITRP